MLEKAPSPLRVRPVPEEESANVEALEASASEILSICVVTSAPLDSPGTAVLEVSDHKVATGHASSSSSSSIAAA